MPYSRNAMLTFALLGLLAWAPSCSAPRAADASGDDPGGDQAGGPGEADGWVAQDSEAADAAGVDGLGEVGASPCKTDPAWTVGLQLVAPGAFDGYTLFAPLQSTTTYLVDLCGQVVHSWPGQATPGNSVYLLDNGQLLRTENVGGATFKQGGTGGRLLLIAWDGAVVWQYEYATSMHRQHHDARMLPSGHVLMIAWELKSSDEAIAAGRDPATLGGGELWSDTLVEVEPSGSTGGNLVWEWHAWDHLVQDFDASKPNYGVVADHPELVDLNFINSGKGQVDWHHANGLHYNPDLDQVIVSIHALDEVWILDRGTSTAEAAGHAGGKRGRGGDLLYRWGNPQSYRAGQQSDTRLFGQHDPQWIEPGLPGAGHLLVFNNGAGRPGGTAYSTLDEWVPPLGADGSYAVVPGEPLGPADLTWQYKADPPASFYSSYISGAQRLPNGNTLACSGAVGTFVEVSPAGEILWRYINPVIKTGPLQQGQSVPTTDKGSENNVFRAYRYAPGYPGLAGRDLTPQGYVELDP